MNEEKTLKEVCSALNVSRRAIQGYEEAGLVKAVGKNKYGHLLYDYVGQERIKFIRFLQDLGMSIREITYVIDAPKEVLIPVIEVHMKKLEEDITKKRIAISKAAEFIKRLDEMGGNDL